MSKNSIVDYLKSQKQNSSYDSRKKLAAEHGITNYTGTAAQNTKLLNVLKSTSQTTSATSSDKVTDTAKPKYTQAQLEKLKDQLGLTRIPTESEVGKLIELKDKIGKPLTAENIRTYYTDLKKKKDTTADDKGDDITDEVPLNNIYDKRDEYLESYVGALGEQFEEVTTAEVEKYKKAQEDYDVDIEYYRQDYEKITSRKNQDYFKGIALQNKEFSKSLDYVANLGSKMVGALEGFGKSRIVEATESKTESDIRYKLSYDRSAEDLKIGKERAEARYKLGTERLSESQIAYEKARDVEKKVMGIEATGQVTRYYDQLIAGQTLQEDEAAKRRKDITGGGTGIEDIFSY